LDTNAQQNRDPTSSPCQQELYQSQVNEVAAAAKANAIRNKRKRREGACALPKLRETETRSGKDFARSALECDASSHRFRSFTCHGHVLSDPSHDIVRQTDVKFSLAVVKDVKRDNQPAFGEGLVAGAGFEPATFRL
jgi:hypothetical protein